MFWKKKKKHNYGFKCSQCEEYHETWPSLGYGAPWHYSQLTEEEKDKISFLNEDFCKINWEEQTDRFIRVILMIPVNNTDRKLEYGLWTSLSEKSFNDYSENFNRTDHETKYTSWICNKLIGYESTISIPTNIFTRTGTLRPILEPQRQHEHQLVTDYINGINKEEAERRIHEMMKNAG